MPLWRLESIGGEVGRCFCYMNPSTIGAAMKFCIEGVEFEGVYVHACREPRHVTFTFSSIPRA